MPERKTLKRARKDKREGKSPSTQAGEFVHQRAEWILADAARKLVEKEIEPTPVNLSGLATRSIGPDRGGRW